jgi:Recombination endonuclease VII
MTTRPRCCKDCPPAANRRPAPHPGPRCATHHRDWSKRNKDLAHGRRVENGYGITVAQYWELYAAQGGRCFVCRKATGATKRLAVEHEHGLCDDHPLENGCPRCIRALTCGRCNRLVAFLDVEALCRAITLLTDPPARKVLPNP